ncbi:MAG: prolipoprotein diacylglyceryl transferase, partial [Planctomycetia bacterium]|nr:prolipoprotein diacylglyceryl transferase [Planctomycetia bacterium]
MHPVLHTPVGDIPSYTALVAAGFLSAALLTWARHRDRGFSADAVFSLTLAACVAGLAGARAWYVATHAGLYAPWFSSFHHGGMDAAAGLVAGAAALVLLALYARPLFRPLGPAAGSVAVLSAALITGLLAARIAALHGIVDADPFDPFGGGLAMFGGLVAGSAACALVARARGIPLPVAADAAAPAQLAAASLGRLGCILN